MTPKERIVSIIEMYEERLQIEGVQKDLKIDVKRTLGSFKKKELLGYAYSLCDEVKKCARDPGKQRKTGSLLATLQACLSFAGLCTLEELINDNKHIT